MNHNFNTFFLFFFSSATKQNTCWFGYFFLLNLIQIVRGIFKVHSNSWGFAVNLSYVIFWSIIKFLHLFLWRNLFICYLLSLIFAPINWNIGSQVRYWGLSVFSSAWNSMVRESKFKGFVKFVGPVTLLMWTFQVIQKH